MLGCAEKHTSNILFVVIKDSMSITELGFTVGISLQLIRKAEFAEGEKVGEAKGEAKIFKIYHLFRENLSALQISEQMGLNINEVESALAHFK